MERKDRLDTFGVTSLVLFSGLLALNQVLIKWGTEGFQPVFMAGLRSLFAVPCIWIGMLVLGKRVQFDLSVWRPAVLMGSLFGVEFILLFTALDLTTVARTTILFYSMPLWLALVARFFLPDEPMTPLKALGLVLAFLGVTWAILARDTSGEASLIGDLCALAGAICWAGILLCARASRFAEVAPEMQLLWQVAISAPILLAASFFFGPFLRDLAMIHVANLAFQTVFVVSMGFMFWLWLVKIYPAATIAAFSFLTPVIGVGLSWLLLGEPIGLTIFASLGLVACGLFLINRPAP